MRSLPTSMRSGSEIEASLEGRLGLTIMKVVLVCFARATQLDHAAASACRFCSLIPGFGAKLSAIILAGPTVLSAVGACPPHDGVRRPWWINVASAVSLMRARKKSGDLTTAIVPAGTSFPARAGTL